MRHNAGVGGKFPARAKPRIMTMSEFANLNEQFGTSDQSRAGRWHLLMPVLIGLMAPALALLLVDARALGSFSVMI